MEPDYAVTPAMFETPPSRVVVLPFYSRKDGRPERADICRRVFYQQFSMLDFSHVNLRRVDRTLQTLPLHEEDIESSHVRFWNPLIHIYRLCQTLDVVGMTTVIDLPSLMGRTESIEVEQVQDVIHALSGRLRSDAYVVGIVRNYGRVYLGIASSLGLSTRVEMRSAATGELLWYGEDSQRNTKVRLTINVFSIPFLLYNTWLDSRGAALDMLAYEVYRDLVQTIPEVGESKVMHVETMRDRTPWSRRPSIWRRFYYGHLAKGETMPFLLERRGWIQGEHPVHGRIWIVRPHARLVAAERASEP